MLYFDPYFVPGVSIINNSALIGLATEHAIKKNKMEGILYVRDKARIWQSWELRVLQRWFQIILRFDNPRALKDENIWTK